MNDFDEQTDNDNIHHIENKQKNSHQLQNQELPPSTSNSRKPLTVNDHKYIGTLNVITELSRQVLNENHDFNTLEKKQLKNDMKKEIANLAALLVANSQLPNGEPIRINTLLCEPKDQELSNENDEWETKTRDVSRRSIKERKELRHRIEPLIDKAIKIEGSELSRGSFYAPSDKELDDMLSLDPKYAKEMKQEFKNTMELRKHMKKESPKLFAQYDQIGRILHSENSATSSPQYSTQ